MPNGWYFSVQFIDVKIIIFGGVIKIILGTHNCHSWEMKIIGATAVCSGERIWRHNVFVILNHIF